MRVPLLLLSTLLLVSFLAPSASATCVMEEHVLLDPIEEDTGTVLDRVVVSYWESHCHPPPHDEYPYN